MANDIIRILGGPGVGTSGSTDTLTVFVDMPIVSPDTDSYGFMSVNTEVGAIISVFSEMSTAIRSVASIDARQGGSKTGTV